MGSILFIYFVGVHGETLRKVIMAEIIYVQIKIPIWKPMREKILDKYNLPKNTEHLYPIKRLTVFMLGMYKGEVCYMVPYGGIISHKKLQSKELTDKLFDFYKIDFYEAKRKGTVKNNGTLITREEAFKLLGATND